MQHYESKIEVPNSYFIEFYLDLIPDYPGFMIRYRKVQTMYIFTRKK